VLVDGVLRLGPGQDDPAPQAGYRVVRVPGGWDVTAPDGGRLLLAAGPGAVEPGRAPAGAGPYHAALLDLIGEPAQLGLLRHRGLVTRETLVAPVCIDHRVRSEEELRRRCELWHVTVADDGSRVTPAPGGADGPWRVLLLGGARSGKSAEAELRLAGEPEVTYVATGPAAGADPGWAARVAAHRSRRPGWWRTAETLDLAGQLRAAPGALLVDGVGTWLAGTMSECGIWAALEERPAPGGPAAASARLAGCVDDLLDAWRHTRAHVVAVSDEAGSGVIPATASGRWFRDELGRLNQLLAADADDAALVVAGRVLPLPV
jgi:adenosylcobinamide kinase/adenosylcobinamide-phosphate guanylyltransferase